MVIGLHYFAVFVSLVDSKLHEPVNETFEHLEAPKTEKLPYFVDSRFNCVSRYLKLPSAFSIILEQPLPVFLASSPASWINNARNPISSGPNCLRVDNRLCLASIVL